MTSIKPIQAICIVKKANPKLKVLEILPSSYLKDLKISKDEKVVVVSISVKE